jgi:hypothetical protein
MKPTNTAATPPSSPDRSRGADLGLKRDPSNWKTGDEPLTAAHRSYVETLATEAGEEVDEIDSLTKAEASEKIEELQHRTGRGKSIEP